MVRDSDLHGKDYLTEKEAAHYCGVSIFLFRQRCKEEGIGAIRHMGKTLYRRADLRGKDYLTEKEAARYFGVSLHLFRKSCEEEGIVCIQHMGEKLYRRSDLQKSIEKHA